jgi:hypothetical protein
MAMEQYQPPGENIMCSCKTVIDFQQSKPADVKEPEGAPVASVTGLKCVKYLLSWRCLIECPD